MIASPTGQSFQTKIMRLGSLSYNEECPGAYSLVMPQTMEQAPAARRGGRAVGAGGYDLNLTCATWSSLLVEMSGVKSTRGPTRV